MKKNISKNDNLLDLIPSQSENLSWSENDEGIVTITIQRNGILERLVRLFCDTPKQMNIALDKTGSIVWKSIDGKNSIYDIGSVLKSELGSEIEPLYERLIMHINILRNNKFISLEKASGQNA